MNHWKTTVAGLLSAFIGIVGPLSGLLASLQAITAQQPGHAPADYRYAIAGAILTFLAAAARVWIGMLQNDAPPPDSVTVQTTMSSKVVPVLLLVLLLGMAAQAQAPAPTLPASSYGFGVSYNNGAKPSLAGTLTYSHLLLSSDTACTNLVTLCYGYTVLDILPLSFNPSVVTTNIGVGVAQKALTIGKVNFFIPASVGPTITGTNVGWNWSGGGLADIPIEKAGGPTHWHVQPNIRFVNANVNGVTNGYQLIFVMNIAFAQ